LFTISVPLFFIIERTLNNGSFDKLHSIISQSSWKYQGEFFSNQRKHTEFLRYLRDWIKYPGNFIYFLSVDINSIWKQDHWRQHLAQSPRAHKSGQLRGCLAWFGEGRKSCTIAHGVPYFQSWVEEGVGEYGADEHNVISKGQIS